MQAIALVALLTFMVNVMLPFAALARLSVPAQGSELSSFFADQKVPVCTPDGFVWMAWEEVQQSGKTPHKGSYHCPLSAAGVMTLQPVTQQPATILFMPIHYPVPMAYVVSDEHWQDAYALIAPPNRAPPVKV